MNKKLFLELLNKYVKGEATVEEEALVLSYYQLFEKEPHVISLLQKEDKEALKKEIFEGIQSKIGQPTVRIPYFRTIPGRTLRNIAATLLVVASLSLFFLVPSHKKKNPALTEQLASKKQNKLFRLPDGSVVMLQNGSKLQYGVDFGKTSKREVFLEGQAYFDIFHDPAKPFIVHAGKIKTTVLGTAFNVDAVKDEQITITVTRGKVRVSDPVKDIDIVTPDQQIIYDVVHGSAEKKVVNATEFLQWKNQVDIALDNISFEETTKILEDKFKTRIILEDPSLKNNRFTTVLLQHETLFQVIQTICDFNGAVWEYNKGKTAILIKKK